jgi:DNA-binding NtrC family response regulator
MAHILVVDDEQRMRHLLTIMLEMKGHKVEQAGDGQEALSMILNAPYDMAIADIKMPHMDGLTLLKRIKEMSLPLPVIFITAFATVDSAVEAMREGAVDYITKPFEEERILLTVEKALSLSRIMAENLDLRQQLQKVAGAGEIVFESEQMEEVVGLCTKVAKREAAVLITGESGTGKEVMARFIHHASHRREARFVPVNCAAMSPNLVESELFGHEKGAFTGADRRRQGKFEYATKGSLFMDEVGELPPEAQVKLLRALEEKKVQRVGGNEEIPVDVRVICATNQDLTNMVENGGFRKDLFFRINVFPIHLPPLRERMDDIVPLAEHFLRRYSGAPDMELTDKAMTLLHQYSWPGNVRELANAMERVVILAEDKKRITEETLSFLRLGAATEDMKISEEFRLPPKGISLETLEKNLVKQALEISGDNQTAAAKLLGVTRAKFRVMLKRVKKDRR